MALWARMMRPAQGGALGARHDQAVQVAEAIGRADLPHVGAEAAKDGLMFDEIALEGEDSYGCHFGFYFSVFGAIRDGARPACGHRLQRPVSPLLLVGAKIVVRRLQSDCDVNFQ